MIKVQAKHLPGFWERCDQVKDPRHPSYIKYTIREMLGTLLFGILLGLESMRQITEHLNHEVATKNVYAMMGRRPEEELPHHVTINELLEKLDPKETEELIRWCVHTLNRRKTFYHARVMGYWLVFVDGTELDEGFKKKNEYYLSRTYNRGKENEFTKYHRSVLEAKIYYGDGIVASLMSEPIQNRPEYSESGMSEEKIKQDCETKAFYRLAERMHQAYPHLPICIVADALYLTHQMIEICRKFGWQYIIRYKEGSASSIIEDFDSLPEKGTVGKDIEFANGVLFGNDEVNFIRYKETSKKGGKESTTTFMWVTSFQITTQNVRLIIDSGRARWKIENQGFNRQKHWQGNLEHAYSWNERAQRNHYLIAQIADLFRQLYEHFYLKKNDISKAMKVIVRHLREDIKQALPEEMYVQTAEQPAVGGQS